LQAIGASVEAEAWGAGAAWVMGMMSDLIGADDHPEFFHPHHPVLFHTHRAARGMRLCRCPTVCEILVPTILEQKVTTLEACRAYRALVMTFGDPAPGPAGLRLPPAARTLASIPYYEWHRLGVERRRAETIRSACSRAAALERLAELPASEVHGKLISLPGVGPWTAAEVRRVALGDRDAVRVGDFHLPHLVSWVLAGEPHSDDTRMMELLEPYGGDRARAVRLIELAGRRPPRRVPRRRLRSIELI
jgi:3-methyladenine DNA glycosylase/8-oxoguanine DNA glycosylase